MEKQKIYEGINASKKQLNEIKNTGLKMGHALESLKQATGFYAGQLGMATDSISKTRVKLSALQDQVDNEKFLSKGARVFINAIIFLLFAILFILFYSLKRQNGLNHQLLIELNKKRNEQVEPVMKNLTSEIQSCKETIGGNYIETNLKLSTGLDSLETKSNQLGHRLTENIARVEGSIGPIGDETDKLKLEQSMLAKTMEDKLNTLKTAVDQRKSNL